MADASVVFTTDLDANGLKSGLTRLKSSVGTFAKGASIAIGAVATGLGFLAKSALTYNSQMEQYYTSFATLLGSQEKATAKIAELKEFAAKTPFEMTDLANAQSMILSFGVAEDKASESMRRLGDISQGNSERFKALSLVYGQMSSTGKLMGQDLLQMINAGFNPLTVIADKTGASVSDLKKKMSGEKTSDAFKKMLVAAQNEVKKLGADASDGAKMLAEIGNSGEISADVVNEAMRLATSEGGLFYQAMEKQSKTAAGLVSTLKDNAKSLLGEVFTGTSEAAKEQALPTALAYVEQLTTAFRSGGTPALMAAFGDVMGDAVSKLSSYTPQIIQMSVCLIKSLLNGLKKNAPVIAKALAETFKEAVIGLIEIAPNLIDVGLELLIELAASLADALPDIIGFLVDAVFNIIVKLVSNAPKLLLAGLKIAAALVEGIAQGFMKLLVNVWDLFTTTTEERLEKAFQNVRGDIRAEITPERQEAITKAINTGIEAANKVMEIDAQVNADTDAVVANIMAAFADGKLTKKESNALGNELEAYVDEGLAQANAYVEEKQAEWSATLSSLTDAKGIRLYTDEDVAALTGGMATAVNGLAKDLEDTYAAYNELKDKLAKPGYHATAQEIALLEELAATVLSIQGEIKKATSDLVSLATVKTERVKRGSGTDEDLFTALGYSKTLYEQEIADIRKLADDHALANQQIIAVEGTTQETMDALHADTDRAYAQADASKTAARRAYTEEIMALYQGMAAQYPAAAAALEQMATLQDRYIEVTNLSSANIGTANDSLLAEMTAWLSENTAFEVTAEQLKLGVVPDGVIDTILQEMMAALTTQIEDANIGLVDNPLLDYLQLMLENGSFEELDITTLDTALEEAFKTIDFIARGSQVGTQIVDGVTGGIGEASEDLTEKDLEALRDAVLKNMKGVFEIHSPARSMFPIGESLVDGILFSMQENMGKVEGIGYGIVDVIAAGVQRNSRLGGMISMIIAAAAAAAAVAASGYGASVGAAFGSGIVAGIQSMVGAVAAAAASLVSATASGARRAAGIHSPSTLFRDAVGKLMASGIGVGFVDMMQSSVIPNVRNAITFAAQAGHDALTDTLLGRVQTISGFNIPSFAGLNNAILRGSLLTGTGSVVNNANSNSSNINYTQHITFESTMQAPDEIAKALRRQAGYGLAGAKA